MLISGMQGLTPAAAAGTAGAGGAAAGAGGAPFGDLLKNAIAGVNDLQDQASTAVQGLLEGKGADVDDAMIATQKADMAFELTLAVRNKAVAAYQQVMSMQF